MQSAMFSLASGAFCRSDYRVPSSASRALSSSPIQLYRGECNDRPGWHGIKHQKALGYSNFVQIATLSMRTRNNRQCNRRGTTWSR